MACHREDMGDSLDAMSMLVSRGLGLMNENPSAQDTNEVFPSSFAPDWIVDLGERCVLGITVDDGCFVVLTHDEWGYWIPTQHIPPRVAVRLGELADLIPTGRYTTGRGGF